MTQDTEEDNGTYIFFEPDATLFVNYCFKPEFIETMLRNYTYLNTGLAIIYNGHRILSRNGLVDLLNDNMTATGLYPIIHLKGEDIEIAFYTYRTVRRRILLLRQRAAYYPRRYSSKSAFKEHIARTIKEFFNKNMDYTDIRNGLVAAIAVNVEEPIFESQTKNQTGLYQYGSRRYDSQQIRRRLHQTGSRQLPAQEYGRSGSDPTKNTGIGKRTQSDRRRNKIGSRTC